MLKRNGLKRLKFTLPLLTILFVIGFSQIASADKYSDTINKFKKSEATQKFFETCYGYAVLPIVGKAGVGIGGSYGAGRVYKDNTITGTIFLVKISVGFQLGGQAFSEIIFLQDERAYNEFISGNFEFDASASAVAITAGAQLKAGTEGLTAGASAGPATGDFANIDYLKGIAVFIQTKGGLMYEASIGGQKFRFTPL